MSRIYLLGYMGSGKSTLGRELHRLTEVPFVDLDTMVEQRYGMTVSEMFAAVGEAEFRRREADTLRLTADMDHVVVALGGGTPCYGDNMDWMMAHGTTVYLDVPVDKLYTRLLRGRYKRPLIAALDDDSLRDFISEALRQRRPWYSRAEAVFDAAALDGELEREETARLFARRFGITEIDNI